MSEKIKNEKFPTFKFKTIDFLAVLDYANVVFLELLRCDYRISIGKVGETGGRLTFPENLL
jgi:hypothetical protein